MRRVPQREWLDEDHGSPEEISASLHDLRRINRLFGGISTTSWLFAQALREAALREASVLEVASGDGYAVQQATMRLPHGSGVELTLLDRRDSHLANGNGAKRITGDALHIPCSDDSFDFVSCGLFIHHLGPDEVIRFVNESLRVARRALLINDLVRSPLHLGLVYLGFPLFRSPITRHDGPASVRQAYTQQELDALLRKTFASRIEMTTRYLYRMAIIVWK